MLAGPGAPRAPPRPLQAPGRPYLVKVGDDLVEQAQALQPFLVDVALRVEYFEVRHRRKHDADAVVGLMVPVLGRARGRQDPMATRPPSGRAAIPPHTPGAGVGGQGGQERLSSGSPPGHMRLNWGP